MKSYLTKPRGSLRWWMYRIIFMTLALVFVGGVFLFPVLLQGVADEGRDWQTLSDVGQAYGGVSALLSGLALCGVALSLVLQWRQTFLAQSASATERHFELVRLALEFPQLSYQRGSGGSDDVYRKKMINNLWVSHWLLLWDIGEIDEIFLEHAFMELFSDQTAREWWQEQGPMWIARNSRRRRDFIRTAWDVYREAVGVSALRADGSPMSRSADIRTGGRATGRSPGVRPDAEPDPDGLPAPSE